MIGNCAANVFRLNNILNRQRITRCTVNRPIAFVLHPFFVIISNAILFPLVIELRTISGIRNNPQRRTLTLNNKDVLLFGCCAEAIVDVDIEPDISVVVIFVVDDSAIILRILRYRVRRQRFAGLSFNYVIINIIPLISHTRFVNRLSYDRECCRFIEWDKDFIGFSIVGCGEMVVEAQHEGARAFLLWPNRVEILRSCRQLTIQCFIVFFIVAFIVGGKLIHRRIVQNDLALDIPVAPECKRTVITGYRRRKRIISRLSIACSGKGIIIGATLSNDSFFGKIHAGVPRLQIYIEPYICAIAVLIRNCAAIYGVILYSFNCKYFADFPFYVHVEFIIIFIIGKLAPLITDLCFVRGIRNNPQRRVLTLQDVNILLFGCCSEVIVNADIEPHTGTVAILIGNGAVVLRILCNGLRRQRCCILAFNKRTILIPGVFNTTHVVRFCHNAEFSCFVIRDVNTGSIAVVYSGRDRIKMVFNAQNITVDAQFRWNYRIVVLLRFCQNITEGCFIMPLIFIIAGYDLVMISVIQNNLRPPAVLTGEHIGSSGFRNK